MKVFISLLFIFLFCPAIYLIEYFVLFPLGLFLVYPSLMVYRFLFKIPYEKLDEIFLTKPFPLNLFLSFWTNSNEPMPKYGKAKYLWENQPSWIRYLKWHVRNPISDFTKYFLGFFKHRDRAVTIGIYKWKFLKLEIKQTVGAPLDFMIFPRLDVYLFGFWLCVGYKKRGCLSLSLKHRAKRPW